MDIISIRIPASPRYVQIVRLMASGLAARLGFTIEDIEDLKIAVDELCAYITGTQGREGTLEVSFEVSEDAIRIEGRADLDAGQKVRSDLTELSRMILKTVTDEASLEQNNGVPTFHITKTRRT